MSRALRTSAHLLVAALFAVVTIAHAGAHLSRISRTGATLASAADGDLGCGLCQNTAAAAPAAVRFAPVGSLVEPVRVLHSAFVLAPASRAQSSRGPPV